MNIYPKIANLFSFKQLVMTFLSFVTLNYSSTLFSIVFVLNKVVILYYLGFYLFFSCFSHCLVEMFVCHRRRVTLFV